MSEKVARPSDRIRVLVVEDEALSRHALCQVLHRSGFFSAGAADGAQALDMVKFFKPQAIIMDLRMPVLDGFETTRRLKADAQTAAIPVLALTGSTDPEDRKQALAAGVDTFLNKPINLDQLMLYLRQQEPTTPGE
jgi:CheY-like chemotaxis protein